MELILDGKKVVEELYNKLPNMDGAELAIITIGDNEASKVYVRNKIKACEKIGLKGVNYKFKGNGLDFTEIISKIAELNHNTNTVGIMIQKPYPKEYNVYNFENLISVEKDVDGLNYKNMYLTLKGCKPYYYPATPKGIMTLLDYYNIPIEGKNVVIIGRSDIVGKPLAAMMLARNATVTLCHSKTEKLKFHTQSADIIISAIGKPKFIDYTFIAYDSRLPHNALGVKPVIIDVGINRDENGKLCGDVDYENVLPYISAITPVPGGVGPMTVYSLMENCADSYLKF